MTFPFPAKPPTDFNPRPPRGGRQRRYPEPACEGGISIHAPREGGDLKTWQERKRDTLISIHAPREGGDRGWSRHQFYHGHISIHAPREGGDVKVVPVATFCVISIHAPREGGDAAHPHSWPAGHGFQSTPPARGGDPCRRPETAAETRNFNPRPPRGGRRYEADH